MKEDSCLFTCCLVPWWSAMHLNLLSCLSVEGLSCSFCCSLAAGSQKLEKLVFYLQEKSTFEKEMPFWGTSTEEVHVALRGLFDRHEFLYPLVYLFGQDQARSKSYAQNSVLSSTLKTEKPPFSGQWASTSRAVYRAWKARTLHVVVSLTFQRTGEKQAFFFICK